MTMLCKAAGCRKPSRSLKYCTTHYSRIRRQGSPYKVAKTRNGKHKRWLIAAIGVNREGCIEWPFPAKQSFGYGQYSDPQSGQGAHRYICFYRHGPEPNQSYEVAHSCGNPACCNWRHLRWATRSENCADKIIHGTDGRGERSSSAKLSETEVIEIFLDPRLCKEIAPEYGISPQQVWAIQNKKSWGWLTNEIA